MVAIKDITLDPEVQLREGSLDTERVQMFIELYAEGASVPPIILVDDGEKKILADGHHRLGAQMRAKATEVEATVRKGDRAEAVALALIENDGGASPLSRAERNKAVKYLLVHGWSQDRIADRVGTVSRHSIGNIADALALKGEVTKRVAKGKGGTGGATPKPLTPLPKEVLEATHTVKRNRGKTPTERVEPVLTDTHLVRLASLPDEKILPMAKAAVEAELTEPQLRAAIQEVKKYDTPIETAVRHNRTVTEHAGPASTPIDAAKSVLRKITDFFGQGITWNGQDMQLRLVIEALAEGKGSDQLGNYPEQVASRLHILATEAEALADHIDNAEAVREMEALS
jgi:hypothetical protein